MLFNPHAYWVFSLITSRGHAYVKSRDQPALCSAIWAALQGQTPDWQSLSRFDQQALSHYQMLKDGNWQPPLEINIQLYVSLRNFGTRVFKFDWNPDSQPYLNPILQALLEPQQSPEVIQQLPMPWRVAWLQMGLLSTPDLLPEAVYLNQVEPEQLIADLPLSAPAARPLESLKRSVEPELTVLPLKAQALWQTAFSPGSELIFSREPVYGMRQPIPAFDWLLKSLSAPESAPLKQHKLLAAGYLPPNRPDNPDFESTQRHLGQLKSQLSEQDYLILPKLLSPLLLALLRQYLRGLYAQGLIQLETDYCRDYIHNEPLMQLIQQELLTVIQKITPEPVLATYSMLAIYHHQADLPRHVDREQCKWNVSLVLDYLPDEQEIWPIYLELAPGQVQEVLLKPGDGVIYSGTRYPHWRNPLPAGRRAVVCFFHFVEADYSGFLY